jgi:addiction module RelB/DinJ family antitoxin
MKTVLNLKIDKALKVQAQKTAEDFGIPLGTLMNAFLRQFVRTKEVNLDLAYQPTKYLADIIRESRADYARREVNGPFDGDALVKRLKKL